MSELASALFSIADASEFRFARFYIVCEAVPLGAPGSPLIVCGVTDTSRGLSKRGQDTESDVKRSVEEIPDFAQKNDRLRLHPETSENFYIMRALFPAAFAFGGMFIPLYLRSWYLREDSASCQYRGSRHL